MLLNLWAKNLKKNKETHKEFKEELVKLYTISEQNIDIIKNVELGNYDNGLRFHYVPKKEKPSQPNRENFNLLYKIVDRHKQKVLFGKKKAKQSNKSIKLNEMLLRTLIYQRVRSVPRGSII